MTKLKHNSLNEEEVIELISHCDNYEDIALFNLAATTGIRREDIVKIEITNIDLDKGNLKFYEAKKKGYHTVPLTFNVTRELKRYIKSKAKKSRFLFDFSGKTAYNKLQTAMKRTTIKKHIAFHDLRRTCVKNWHKKGLDDKTISQILNDKIETVRMYYQHKSIEELKDEVDEIDKEKNN